MSQSSPCRFGECVEREWCYGSRVPTGRLAGRYLRQACLFDALQRRLQVCFLDSTCPRSPPPHRNCNVAVHLTHGRFLCFRGPAFGNMLNSPQATNSAAVIGYNLSTGAGISASICNLCPCSQGHQSIDQYLECTASVVWRVAVTNTGR